MISIIEGFGVGAGKSYFATTQILQHMLDGGTCYIAETMQLKWQEFKAYAAKKFGLQLEDSQYNVVSADQITHLHENTPPGTEECPVLIVVDEVHMALNARDWADKKKRPLFDWCTQSRHDDNDLLFISQSACNIDKQLRRLATYNWRIRNSEKLGDGNPLKVWLKVWRLLSFGLHGGPQFIVTQLDQDGLHPLGPKVFLPQDPEVFKIYTSKSMKGKHKRGGAAVARVELKKVNAAKANARKHPYMKYAILLIVAVLCIVGYRLAHTDWSFGKKHETVQVASTIAPNSTPTPSASAAARYDVEHEPWRARGPGWVRTPSGLYKIGAMSRAGMVKAIADGIVLVERPNGRLLYLVTEDESTSHGPVASTAPTPQGSPSPIIVAPAYTVAPLTDSATWKSGVTPNH